MTYTAKIDGGEGGETTITAESAATALVQAIEWAEEGDWPEEGCTCEVLVVNDQDEDDYASSSIEIKPALQQKAEDGEEIGRDEGEWDTQRLMRVEDEYFLVLDNGGARGARDRQRGDGSWPHSSVISTEEVNRTEARRLLLEWGYSPAEVVARTKA